MTIPRWLISVYLFLAFCLQALVWGLVCWWPLGYWPPITILDTPSPDLSAAWSVGGNLVTDHRSPLLAIVPLTSLPPGPRVTLRVVHVVLCCWRHRLPMTDRITFQFTFSHTKCCISVKTVIVQHPFTWEGHFIFYREQFLTTFKKQLHSS